MLMPDFKVVVNDADITNLIKSNLISLSYDDKEGKDSDEISISLNGLYDAPKFGDKIELYLGYINNLYKCGSFNLQTVCRDFKANTTEIRATSVDFADENMKVKRTRTFENTSIFGIAKKIANEENLGLKTNGDDLFINSKLQDNISNIEFLYNLAFLFGYLMAVKNKTIIIGKKTDLTDAMFANTNLNKFILSLDELYELEIMQAYRNTYKSVEIEWQDIATGDIKSLKARNGKPSYRMRIAQPKNESEAYSRAEAKLNELLRGGISGKCRLAGANIICGATLTFKNTLVADIEGKNYHIKSVNHNLDNNGYIIEIEFEG